MWTFENSWPPKYRQILRMRDEWRKEWSFYLYGANATQSRIELQIIWLAQWKHHPQTYETNTFRSKLSPYPWEENCPWGFKSCQHPFWWQGSKAYRFRRLAHPRKFSRWHKRQLVRCIVQRHQGEYLVDGSRSYKRNAGRNAQRHLVIRVDRNRTRDGKKPLARD